MNNSLSFHSFPNLFSRTFIIFIHLILSPFDLISFSLFLHAFSTHSINDLSRGYYYFLYFYVIWKISLETNFSGNKVYKHHFNRDCLVTFALFTEIIAGHRLIKCPYISSFSFFQFSFNLFFFLKYEQFKVWQRFDDDSDNDGHRRRRLSLGVNWLESCTVQRLWRKSVRLSLETGGQTWIVIVRVSKGKPVFWTSTAY